VQDAERAGGLHQRVPLVRVPVRQRGDVVDGGLDPGDPVGDRTLLAAGLADRVGRDRPDVFLVVGPTARSWSTWVRSTGTVIPAVACRNRVTCPDSSDQVLRPLLILSSTFAYSVLNSS
jgi:hypothetical protein